MNTPSRRPVQLSPLEEFVGGVGTNSLELIESEKRAKQTLPASQFTTTVFAVRCDKLLIVLRYPEA